MQEQNPMITSSHWLILGYKNLSQNKNEATNKKPIFLGEEKVILSIILIVSC